ncbi:MAG: YceI family protein [Maritimibacter sp.]
MKHFLTCIALLAFSLPSFGAPVSYALDKSNSSVTYQVMFGQDPINGTLPIGSAQIALDFEENARSSVAVTLNTTGATASFPFAQQAMRGPKVLDAKRHPTLTFKTTNMKLETPKARVVGQVTIRGVTRPVTLDAEVYRQKGSAEGDFSRMAAHLTGSVNRSDFGADGWSDMVSDKITIKIVARMTRQ